MSVNTVDCKRIGEYYETLACQMLQTDGLQVVERNYQVARVGEIDIVAMEQRVLPTGRIYSVLVFVEVRARAASQFGGSLVSVTKSKQKRIIETAQHFLQTNIQYKDCDCRFDVVAFDIDKLGQMSSHWVKGAFLVP